MWVLMWVKVFSGVIVTCIVPLLAINNDGEVLSVELKVLMKENEAGSVGVKSPVGKTVNETEAVRVRGEVPLPRIEMDWQEDREVLGETLGDHEGRGEEDVLIERAELLLVLGDTPLLTLTTMAEKEGKDGEEDVEAVKLLL